MPLASSHDETAPLLADRPTSGAIRQSTGETATASQATRASARFRRCVILTAAFIVLYQLADILRFAPSVRLFELGYCRRYWSERDPSVIDQHGNVPEELCKNTSIQSSLSGLRAWLGTIEGLIGLVLVLPYGVLADKKGRRFVAAINLVGYMLSGTWILIVCYSWKTFPIEAVMFSPVFRAIGGGAPVVSAVLLAMLAAAAPPDQRSTVFFWMGAAELITEAAAPLLAALLLDKGFMFLPILLGYPLELLGLLVLYLMPEDDPKASEDFQETPQATQDSDSTTPQKHHLSTSQKARVAACLLVFLIAKFGRQMLEMLVQYTSQRFRWSLAKASTLLSARAFANIALLLVLLPFVKEVLRRYTRYSANTIDLRIAQVSALLLTVGSLVLGLAQTVPVLILGLLIFTLGNGCRQALQSYMTSFVSREQIASLYTLIALVDGIGSMLGAAVLNGSLKTAFEKGKTLLGLPFFIAAGLYGTGSVLLCLA